MFYLQDKDLLNIKKRRPSTNGQLKKLQNAVRERIEAAVNNKKQIPNDPPCSNQPVSSALKTPVCPFNQESFKVSQICFIYIF